MTICQWRCTSVGNTCIGRLNPIGPCSKSSIYTMCTIIVYIELDIYHIYINCIYRALVYYTLRGERFRPEHGLCSKMTWGQHCAPWIKNIFEALIQLTINRIKTLTMWSSYSPEMKKWTSWLFSFHFPPQIYMLVTCMTRMERRSTPVQLFPVRIFKKSPTKWLSSKKSPKKR